MDLPPTIRFAGPSALTTAIQVSIKTGARLGGFLVPVRRRSAM